MASGKKQSRKTKEPGKINRNQRHTPVLSDLGTPELENHCKLAIEYVDAEGELTEPGKGRKRARNLTQTTLDYLKQHGKLINDDQYHAGERLYWDCYMAGYVPRAVAMLPDGIPHTKTNKFFYGFAEGRVDCQRRYFHISKELSKRYVVRPRPGMMEEPEKTGITFWQVVYKICIDGIAVDALEKWTDWPRRSGKKLIGLVLDDLYDLYEEIYRKGTAWKD